MTDSQDYFTPVSHLSEEEAAGSTASEAPLLTKSVRRPRLTERMVNNLVARRYGSLHDFSKVVARWCDISRATGIHPGTVRKAIATFHKRGNRFLKCCAANFAMGRPRHVPQDVEAQLITREKLYEMRFLSLRRRAELIRREHGLQLSSDVVKRMYKRNRIRYLQATKVKRTTPAHEARLELERVAFARKLHTLQEQHGEQLIYMDQTTFQL